MAPLHVVMSYTMTEENEWLVITMLVFQISPICNSQGLPMWDSNFILFYYYDYDYLFKNCMSRRGLCHQIKGLFSYWLLGRSNIRTLGMKCCPCTWTWTNMWKHLVAHNEHDFIICLIIFDNFVFHVGFLLQHL